MSDPKPSNDAPNPVHSRSRHDGFPKHAYCKQCDYQLYRADCEACPECGGRVEPSDPLTYWDARDWPETKRWAWGMVFMFGIPILFIVFWMRYEYA